MISVIAGVSSAIVLAIMGVPFPVALGLLVAILDLIPLAGATLAGIVLAAVGYLTSVTAGIVVVTFFVLYQQLENHVLQPLVYGRTVELSPLVVLVAILIGAEVAGVLGALGAIPIAGTIQILLVDWLRHRRTEHSDNSGALDFAARTVSPDLVVIATTMPGSLHPQADRLRDLAPGHRCAVGGRAASPALASALGAEHLPGDPITAAFGIAARRASLAPRSRPNPDRARSARRLGASAQALASSASVNAMYVSLSRLRVAASESDALVTAFRRRAHLVDTFDGFIDLQVWRSDRHPEEVLMVSRWRDRAAFTAYMRSAEHRTSHDRIHPSLQAAIRLERLEHLHTYEVLAE